MTLPFYSMSYPHDSHGTVLDIKDMRLVSMLHGHQISLKGPRHGSPSRGTISLRLEATNNTN